MTTVAPKCSGPTSAKNVLASPDATPLVGLIPGFMVVIPARPFRLQTYHSREGFPMIIAG
ncbi:hypothetical protein D3C83_314640 [compost metagenome]